MQIEIPDELCEQIGYCNGRQLVFEVTMLADRNPIEITGSKFPDGIVMFVKEDEKE
tara:strand:+ start:201 stop:368 length:168 start_codon:yes stop_codon:yes gene_type:complete